MTELEKKWQLRVPRTWKGWKVLFWLSLRRCPFHHKKLCHDYPYSSQMYGFCCDGISMWPNGLFDALWNNYKAEQNQQEAK